MTKDDILQSTELSEAYMMGYRDKKIDEVEILRLFNGMTETMRVAVFEIMKSAQCWEQQK